MPGAVSFGSDDEFMAMEEEEEFGAVVIGPLCSDSLLKLG